MPSDDYNKKLQVVGSITITACKFKRKAESEWELGWDVNEGDGMLLDRNGKRVGRMIWDIKYQHYFGFYVLHRVEGLQDTLQER